MELKTEVKPMWTCPTCGRQFERHNQSHSCRAYPLQLHFKGKETVNKLYDILCKRMEQKIGDYKIESLECCIHFVSTFTFAAVKILKDKLLIDFSFSRLIKNKRFIRTEKLSEHRFLYYVEIKNASEIDNELINWLKEAYDKKSENKLN